MKDETKKKLLKGLGIAALVLSIIAALYFIEFGFALQKGYLQLATQRFYLTIGVAVVAAILGKIADVLGHSNKSYGSIAFNICVWLLIAGAVLFVFLLFFAV